MLTAWNLATRGRDSEACQLLVKLTRNELTRESSKRMPIFKSEKESEVKDISQEIKLTILGLNLLKELDESMFPTHVTRTVFVGKKFYS